MTKLLKSEKCLSKRNSILFILRGCLLACICSYLLFSPLPLYYATVLFAGPYFSYLYDLSPYEKVLGFKPLDVFIDSPGGKLHGWYFKNPGAKYTVMLCHGMGNNVSIFGPDATILAQQGASVLVFDYKGVGRSKGSPSLVGMADDTRAAYSFLVDKQKVPANSIVVYAISLGTAPASALAAEKKCKALILLSPYVSLRAAGKRMFPHLQAYPDCFYPEHDIGCLSYATQFKAPTLIIHGDQDTTIPLNEGRRIFEAVGCKKQFLCLKGIGHSDYYCFPKLQQNMYKEMAEFIADADKPGQESIGERSLVALR